MPPRSSSSPFSIWPNRICRRTTRRRSQLYFRWSVHCVKAIVEDAMDVVEQQVTELQGDAESWDAQQALRWGLSTFGPSLALASSFGAEDVVLIDIASRISKFRVFTLDTDFLFPETYALIGEIEARYGVEVERTRSELTPEAQTAQYGPALWSSRPDTCCQLRKVEPLKKKLSGLAAWVTGVRRDQAPTRANTRKLEWDAKFGLVKLNPLADWNWSEVWG